MLIAVGLEGAGQSGPYPGFDGQCAGRALPVGDPVDGAARPDGAAAAGTVRGRRVEVAPGVHGVRLEIGALAAEADVETAGSGAFEVVEQPQFAGRGVADAGAVGRRVAGVEAVGLGVPAQVGAVGERGVERADAFVVGEEGETVADPHRAFDVAVEALVDPYELRDAVRSLAFPGRLREPQLARRAAPVALPGGGLTPHGGGEQQDPAAGSVREGADRSVRQGPGGPAIDRDGAGPAAAQRHLPLGADDQDVAFGVQPRTDVRASPQ